MRRPEATEISLKVYRADEERLGERTGETNLQWWVGFGEGAKGRVKECEYLQDNASLPQFCPVLHRCRQQWGLQHFCQVSASFGCGGHTQMAGTECEQQLLFRLGSSISGIKRSWSRNVTAGLTTIDYNNRQGGAASGYMLVAAGDCRRPGRAAGSLKDTAA